MPRALIVTEPPVAPEPFRLALLGIGYNVVDEIDDAQRLVKSAIEAAHARCLETGRPGTRRNETPRRSLWRDEAVLLSDRIVMMTNAPAATIGEILNLPLARPRDRLALAHDAQSIDCRSAVLEFLYQKQRKQAA